jgi:hypothetical protein
VIASADAEVTTTAKVPLADCPPASLTFTVKLEVPALEGVPEMDPVVEDNVNPTGRDPDARLQV